MTTEEEVKAMRRLLEWGASFNGFPYGTIAFWVEKYADYNATERRGAV